LIRGKEERIENEVIKKEHEKMGRGKSGTIIAFLPLVT